MKLSLVMPAYNEVAIAAESVRVVDAVLRELGIDYEIIVADDGSEDATAAAVEGAGVERAKVVREVHRGKGSALTAGFREAQGEYLAFIDIDREISEEYIPVFIAALDEGHDVVIGSKVLDREYSRRRPLKRRVITSCFNWLVRLMFGTGISDHQAGIKFFRREILEPELAKLTSEGWLWDTEVLARCAKRNARVHEIAVATRPVRPGHVNVVSTSWEMLLSLLTLKRKLGNDD
jgi:glycosyltransferase involved in cell wall biosynthesis